jgi:hypothetical protein
MARSFGTLKAGISANPCLIVPELVVQGKGTATLLYLEVLGQLKVGKFRKCMLYSSRADGTMEENAAALYCKVD